LVHTPGINSRAILGDFITATPAFKVVGTHRYIAMDNAARAQLLAEAAGTPKPMPHDLAKLTASQVGTHKGGYFSFQPLWDWISEAEPDLFN
jgi:hypothetical protein